MTQGTPRPGGVTVKRPYRPPAVQSEKYEPISLWAVSGDPRAVVAS